ncbi:MAG: epimerase [Gemmatimonadota bacterium]|nr:epimerase [Gemmatimonadota bacterium]
MKVILFGSTGMVGQGVLRECLRDPDVTEVLAIVRSATRQQHRKLREIIHKNFTDFSTLQLDGDACFWCLGVSSAGMKEADYTRITYDFTIAAAKVLARPTMTFIFVSGTGADGSAMWARVKRKTEVALLAMPFKRVYVFRPGLIQPLHGIRSRTRLYNVLYPIIYPLMLVARLVAPRHITDTERVGKAMLNIARRGFPKQVLENPDINAAAE